MFLRVTYQKFQNDKLFHFCFYLQLNFLFPGCNVTRSSFRFFQQFLSFFKDVEIEIVEKSGTKIVGLLQRNDPSKKRSASTPPTALYG